MPEEKCISCELTNDEIIKEYGQNAVEGGYYLEKGFLCEPCAACRARQETICKVLKKARCLFYLRVLRYATDQRSINSRDYR